METTNQKNADNNSTNENKFPRYQNNYRYEKNNHKPQDFTQNHRPTNNEDANIITIDEHNQLYGLKTDISFKRSLVNNNENKNPLKHLATEELVLERK
ncbi:hypothetical protein BB561_006555 [Smittium simulii]|uniref:Uncharacterized protein n=1 Tax=Smittium simulii TaxID=133385 RepID=A0A2T9Y348_9FUNG|nr:hypothetical protein BB561_006555 [Smittium simulii]